MSNLVRKPYSIFDEFNRLMNVWEDEQDSSRGALSNWHPTVDIKETPQAFVLIADLPGVAPQDIDISMENNILSLKGSRSSIKEDSNEKYSRTERVQGTFFRRFTLPETADAAKIEAKSKHGVLELTIPKIEKAQPQRIEIKVDGE